MGFISNFNIEDQAKVSYDTIIHRMKSGHKLVEELCNYMKERIEVEERYAQELTKIHFKHFNDTALQNLKITNDLYHVIKKFADHHSEMALVQSQFSRDIKDKVEVPLRQSLEHDQHWKDFKQYDAELKKLVGDLEEKESKYKKAVDKKKKEKKIKDAEEQFKRAKDQWLLHALQHFETFESMDKIRLDAIKLNLGIYNQFETSLIERKQNASETFMVINATFDPQQDIDAFCKEFGNTQPTIPSTGHHAPSSLLSLPHEGDRPSPRPTNITEINLSSLPRNSDMIQPGPLSNDLGDVDSSTNSSVSHMPSMRIAPEGTIRTSVSIAPSESPSHQGQAAPRTSMTISTNPFVSHMEKHFEEQEEDDDDDHTPLGLMVNHEAKKPDEENDLEILRKVSLNLKPNTRTSITNSMKHDHNHADTLIIKTSIKETGAEQKKEKEEKIIDERYENQHESQAANAIPIPDTRTSLTVHKKKPVVSLDICEVIHVLMVDGKIDKLMITGEVQLETDAPIVGEVQFKLRNHERLEQYACHPSFASYEESSQVLMIKNVLVDQEMRTESEQRGEPIRRVPIMKYKVAIDEKTSLAENSIPILLNSVWKLSADKKKADVVVAVQESLTCPYLDKLHKIQVVASVNCSDPSQQNPIETGFKPIVSFPVGVANANHSAILWTEHLDQQNEQHNIPASTDTSHPQYPISPSSTSSMANAPSTSSSSSSMLLRKLCAEFRHDEFPLEPATTTVQFQILGETVSCLEFSLLSQGNDPQSNSVLNLSPSPVAHPSSHFNPLDPNPSTTTNLNSFLFENDLVVLRHVSKKIQAGSYGVSPRLCV